MSTPSTISLDTELSAVNSILGSIGQAPVSSLDFDNPEISLIHNLLREINVDVQSEGWHFNSDKNVKTSPDADGYFNVPANVVRYDITDGQDNKDTNVVIRNGRLYDKYHRTDVFTEDKYIDSVTLFDFGEIPSVFRRYITYRAAGRAATQLIANPQLVQLLASQEAQARAACIEYECEQGDHNFMGWPDGTSYQAYQPYHGLRRH